MSFLTPSPYQQRRKTFAVRQPILSKLEREFPEFYQKQNVSTAQSAIAAPSPPIPIPHKTGPNATPTASAAGSPPLAPAVRGSPTPSTQSWRGSSLYPPSPFQLAMERQKQERDARKAAKRKSLGESGSVWSRASSVARSVADNRSVAMSSRGISPALSRSEFARSSMTMSREARKDYENRKRKEMGGGKGSAMSPPRPSGSMSLYSFGSNTSRPASRQSTATPLNTADDLRSILARAKAARTDDAIKRQMELAERRKEAIRVKLEEEERTKRENAMEQYIQQEKQASTPTPSSRTRNDVQQAADEVIIVDDEEGNEERVTKRMRSEESEGYQRMQETFYNSRKEEGIAAATVASAEAAAGITETAAPLFSKQISASPPRKRGNEDDLDISSHKRHQGKISVGPSFVGESPLPASFERFDEGGTSARKKKVNGSFTDLTNEGEVTDQPLKSPKALFDTSVSFGSLLATFSSPPATSEVSKQPSGSLLESFLGMEPVTLPYLPQTQYPDLSGTSTQLVDGVFSTQQDNEASTQITEPVTESITDNPSTATAQIKLGNEISSTMKSDSSDIVTFHGTKSRSASAEFAKPPLVSPTRSVRSNQHPASPTSPAYHTRSAERRLSMSMRQSSQLASSPEVTMSPIPPPRIFSQPMVVVDKPASSSRANAASSTMADAFSHPGVMFQSSKPLHARSNTTKQADSKDSDDLQDKAGGKNVDDQRELSKTNRQDDEIENNSVDDGAEAQVEASDDNEEHESKEHAQSAAAADSSSDAEHEQVSSKSRLSEGSLDQEDLGTKDREAEHEHDSEGSEESGDEVDRQASDGENHDDDYGYDEYGEEEEEHEAKIESEGYDDFEEEYDDEEDGERENGYDDDEDDGGGEGGEEDDEDDGEGEVDDEEDYASDEDDYARHPDRTPSSPPEIITIDSDSD